MNVLHELIELDAWLEGGEDIDAHGGPNTAMRVRQVLAESLPVLAELIAATRLSCRTDRVTDGLREALAKVGGA